MRPADLKPSAMGQANMTEPEGGFDSDGLAKMFQARRSMVLGYAAEGRGARLCGGEWRVMIVGVIVAVCGLVW